VQEEQSNSNVAEWAAGISTEAAQEMQKAVLSLDDGFRDERLGGGVLRSKPEAITTENAEDAEVKKSRKTI
jgi:hypothetical protein